jgi:hypothetical protein
MEGRPSSTGCSRCSSTGVHSRTHPRLDRVLAAFGGSRVVHGHTPIALVLDKDPAKITGPLVYAGGRAVNVDHCLFAGGPGFVVELGEISAEAGARSWRRSRRFGPRRHSG